MLIISLVLSVLSVGLLLWLRLAPPAEEVSGALRSALEPLQQGLERAERTAREEMGRGREEAAQTAMASRQELAAAIRGLSDSLQTRLAEGAAATERHLEATRADVGERLKAIQGDNAQKLEQMRLTVDEKLQGTLDKRLGESFRQVSERLELVHRGIGEMQSLASGVGDLKRVLTNVKARGTWGEIQLGALLEQVLTPDQYGRNVRCREESSEQVEFAVRMPGPGTDQPVWLPIDSKFPQEDYLRLVEAADRADAAAVSEASAALAARVIACAKDISGKYICPPRTTDFAILFLPTEGLYAEVLRRAGILDELQKQRVVLAGPTTLAALLNSLQMGFRTLAIQEHSSEAWRVLGAVKAEFEKFGDVIEKIQKKLKEASHVVDDVAQRKRAMDRRLRDVEVLPAAEADHLLGFSAAAAPEEPEADLHTA